MGTLREFWGDQAGSIVSAEMVLVGTVVTVGAVTGLQTVAENVNDELRDVSQAIRKVDQSYSYSGMRGCFSHTAGSAFFDPTSGTPPPEGPKRQPAAPQTSGLAPTAPQFEFAQPTDELEAPQSPDDTPATAADAKL